MCVSGVVSNTRCLETITGLGIPASHTAEGTLASAEGALTHSFEYSNANASETEAEAESITAAIPGCALRPEMLQHWRQAFAQVDQEILDWSRTSGKLDGATALAAVHVGSVLSIANAGV